MLADRNLMRWRRATSEALAAANQDDGAEAARLYHTAVREAEQLLLHRCEDLPAARIYTATWRRLAESYRRLGREDLAFMALQQAAGRLIAVIGDALLPHRFRNECMQEFSRTLLPLLTVLRETPEGTVEAQRLLNQAREAWASSQLGGDSVRP